MNTEEDIDIEADFADGDSITGELFPDFNESSRLASFQAEIVQHPWTLEQDWLVEHCPDERSRALIEKMVHEETYFSRNKTSMLKSSSLELKKIEESTTSKYKTDQPANPVPVKVDQPANTVPAKGKWTTEEKELFMKGYEIFGRKWSKITELIPNRTVLQVKHYAYSYFKKTKKTVKPSTTETVSVCPVSPGDSKSLTKKGESSRSQDNLAKFPDSELVHLQKDSNIDSDDCDVDVDDSDGVDDTSASTSQRLGLRQSLNTETTQQTSTELHVEADFMSVDEKEHSKQAFFKRVKLDEAVDDSTEAPPKTDSLYERINVDISGNQSAALDDDIPVGDDFAIQGSYGRTYPLPNPTTVMDLDVNEVSDQEKEIFAEFFDSKNLIKTAERYKKIRNYILNAWKGCQPAYLKKTSLRSGLKKCGDVNIVGRIHAYLEQVGAINFGCEEVQYKRRVRLSRRRTEKPARSEQTGSLASSLKEVVSQRKRRVRDVFGIWTDESEMEGRTIDHEKETEEIVRKLPTKPRRKPALNDHDPFKLVQCQGFTDAFPAPFDIEVEVSAMMVLDTHAHLCKTEVIGLLGGQYDVKRGLLQIQRAEPCDSISTGMQCEMDPVSQSEAYERLRQEQLRVVGWYHSHPTFPPNPSVRDIETQQNMQEWFLVGKMPFVGVIVNPFCSDKPRIESDVRCLVISKPEKPASQLGTPYRFAYKVVEQSNYSRDSLTRLKALVQKYSSSSNRVDLKSRLSPDSPVNCIDKLIRVFASYSTQTESDRSQTNLELYKLVDSLYTEKSDGIST